MISQTVSLFWDDMGLAALWSGETALGVLDPMMGIDEAEMCSRLAFVPSTWQLPAASLQLQRAPCRWPRGQASHDFPGKEKHAGAASLLHGVPGKGRMEAHHRCVRPTWSLSAGVSICDSVVHVQKW